jgi:hypothetical protein
VDERAVAPAALADARTLDLDDLGAHISQNHRAERSRHDVGHVHDSDAC